MSKIKIFSDSTCDLSEELVKKHDIGIVPLYVGFGDETLKDGVEITTETLYRKVEETKSIPKTSAPPPNDFHNLFKPYIDSGYEILYIGISSHLSSTLQNAKIAITEFENGKIEILDSLNLSTGIGLLVLKAIDLRDKGLTLKDICENLSKTVPQVKTNFIIDTLNYLHKGGRCSALQSIVSSVLKIRPIIMVEDGKMIVGKKVRGKRIKALNSILESCINDKDKVDKSRIIITHSLSNKDALYLKDELSKNIDVENIIITKAGCVISSHCGPNTIGIIYINN